MELHACHPANELDPRYKIFPELMEKRVLKTLLVSTLYDACIMEKDGRLAKRIIHEYRGLNLSHPPRFTRVSSAEEALRYLDNKHFHMVTTMERLADMDGCAFGERRKSKNPDLPVILLSHQASEPRCTPDGTPPAGIDRTLFWTGSIELLLAIRGRSCPVIPLAGGEGEKIPQIGTHSNTREVSYD